MYKQNRFYGKSYDESIDILRDIAYLYFVIRGACNEKIQQDTT